MQLFRRVTLATSRPTRYFSSRVRETEEWGVFPREEEGNELIVNWSLANDGVANTTKAYRNGRLPVLAMRLSSKIEGNKVEEASPLYTGATEILEAGTGISFDKFQQEFSSHKAYLSSGIDLFIEDRGLGSYQPYRLGVRIVTDDAALALIVRKLLVCLFSAHLNAIYLMLRTELIADSCASASC